MEPQIRFCTSADGTRIAYVVLGDQPGMPLVQVSSWLASSELAWDPAGFRDLHEGLARDRR